MKLTSFGYSLACLAGFVSPSALAFYPLWLAPLMLDEEPQWTLAQVSAQSDLFDCGLEADNELFCSDEIRYYKVPVLAEISIDDGDMSQIQLQRGYSLLHYSELQINLRKDGFLLKEVHIGGESFIVDDVLKTMSMEAANKALVPFLNRSTFENQRTLLWLRGDKSRAKLTTDKEFVTVVYSYQE